jgi:phosphoribosylaminoimidazole-succinocarboxamide synthase
VNLRTPGSCAERNTATIITPTTKGGPSGHDERLTCAEVVERGLLDEATWEQVQSAALGVFARGQEVARLARLILVDTKYEFGRAPDGRVLLIDEVHTPDSSRYWKADTYTQCLERANRRTRQSSSGWLRWRCWRGTAGCRMSCGGSQQRYISIFEMLTRRLSCPVHTRPSPGWLEI